MTQAVPNPSPVDPARLRQIAVALLRDLPKLVQRMVGKPLSDFVPPDDIAQEASLAFHEALATFTPRTTDIEGDLRALLSTIVRNRIADAARRFDRMAPTVEESVLEQARQDGRTASRKVAKEQSLTAVRDCLSKLDKIERDILWRRHAEDQKFAEIAAHLGMTEGQVDGLYRRALKRLLDMLGSAGNFQFASSRG